MVGSVLLRAVYLDSCCVAALCFVLCSLFIILYITYLDIDNIYITSAYNLKCMNYEYP